MSFLIPLLASVVAAQTAFLYACLAASLVHFRFRRRVRKQAPRLTLIKPIKGLDEALDANLDSIVESDPSACLQVLIAMESAEDPAYPAARAFAERHKGRDISVLLTGESGPRMGKIHNMIVALPHAKHPAVIFSDADVRASAGLLEETAWALANGYDAVYGLPFHEWAPGLGGWQMMTAFNHSFCVPAALNFILRPVDFRFCAGGWMAFTRERIEKAGGLEPLAHEIADDFALSRQARLSGAKAYLLAEPARVRESGLSAKEAFAHLCKWASIIHWSLPWPFRLAPAVNLGVLSMVLWLTCELTGESVVWGRGLAAAAFISRGLVGFIQDAGLGGARLSWWGYPLLCFADLGSLVFWAAGLRSRVTWRGKTYRLHRGGRAEVI